ncbi:MAG: TetR/AcrR family transcriptional regulator [Caldilineaceae bacterium]
MSEQENSDAKQRVLDVAEELFMQRGYAAITLRDIADALGIRQASLYYHFPEGKEQLFIAVTTRVFTRHQAGMEQAIEQAGDGLAAQLYAVADWFASQRPMNLLGMMHADVPALSKANAEHLSQVAYSAMFTPLRRMFLAAETRREIRVVHPDLLAGCFLSLMDGLHHGQHRPGAPPRQMIIDEIIKILLDGLRPRAQ